MNTCTHVYSRWRQFCAPESFKKLKLNHKSICLDWLPPRPAFIPCPPACKCNAMRQRIRQIHVHTALHTAHSTSTLLFVKRAPAFAVRIYWAVEVAAELDLQSTPGVASICRTARMASRRARRHGQHREGLGASQPAGAPVPHPACMLYKPQALRAALAACTHPATGPVPIHSLHVASSPFLSYYCTILTKFGQLLSVYRFKVVWSMLSAYLHDPRFKFKATLMIRAVLTSEHTCEG